MHDVTDPRFYTHIRQLLQTNVKQESDNTKKKPGAQQKGIASMFAKAPAPRKKEPVPKREEKPAVEDETSPGKENRMNEAVEDEEAAKEVEKKETKGKKKRGAAARAESKPKRKRIQVGKRLQIL